MARRKIDDEAFCLTCDHACQPVGQKLEIWIIGHALCVHLFVRLHRERQQIAAQQALEIAGHDFAPDAVAARFLRLVNASTISRSPTSSIASSSSASASMRTHIASTDAAARWLPSMAAATRLLIKARCLETWMSRSPSRTVTSSPSSSRSSDSEIAHPLRSPARVPALPRAKLMRPGRSFVADRVGLFVFSHYDVLLFLGCDLNTRAAPTMASRASAERFCSTDRKGSSLGGRGGVAHYQSAMHTRRQPTADAVLPCSV